MVAVLLLLSYGLAYVPPKTFSLISVLSLTVPLLIVLNVLFVIYWLIKLKKQLILSLLVLGIGYTHVLSFYKFTSEHIEKTEETFTIMSYNVRLFNVYNWIDDETIPTKIKDFINDETPNIVCFQEFDSSANLEFTSYPYKHQTNNSSLAKQESPLCFLNNSPKHAL